MRKIGIHFIIYPGLLKEDITCSLGTLQTCAGLESVYTFEALKTVFGFKNCTRFCARYNFNWVWVETPSTWLGGKWLVFRCKRLVVQVTPSLCCFFDTVMQKTLLMFSHNEIACWKFCDRCWCTSL